MTGPTHEQWLLAIGRSATAAEDAMTIIGWSKKLGLSRSSALIQEWIRTGLANGWLERAVVELEDLTLRRRRVSGFRLVSKQKSPGME